MKRTDRPSLPRRIALITCLIGFLAACGDSDTSGSGTGTSTPITIGMFQIVEHPAVDALREGFEEVLREAKEVNGRAIQFDYKNAQNDPTLIEQIADRFVADNVDLVYAMGTPVVASIAAKTRKIPIVLGATTDPVSSGFAKSWESSGRNIAGTSDLPPVRAQFELAKKLVPKLKAVGVIYNAGEKNSTAVLERARDAAKALGLNLVERTATTTAEVPPAVTSLVGRCQAIYLPPDNTVHAALPALMQVARDAKIPVFNCTEDTVKAGALFALSVDYRELGRLSGRIALQVLRGKAPSEIPIQVIDQPALVINKKTAEALGLSFPADVLKRAKSVDGN